MDAAIEVKDLCKSFNGTEFVLKDLDLVIDKGSLTVIIGFSGTGKSVLLKHLLGLLRPTSGQITILGQDINELSDFELAKFRTRFGVLFQHSALFDDMTVLENVCFPLFEHRRDWNRARKVEVAKEKLKAVEFDAKDFDKLPSELSGGMRKRVGLARAIALDPDILVYDEPTTGLDPIRTEMVDDLIFSTHAHRAGITSIVVSHDLHAAFRLGDTIAMLNGGKVLLKGTREEFFASEIDLVRRFLQKGMKKE